MNHEEFFDFPAEHTEFYNAFEPWRISKNRDSVTKEGVYYLLAGKPVPRCLKEDQNGILYIGKGIILKPLHRLGKLINAINNTEAMHKAGVRFNKNLLNEMYHPSQIKVRVVLCENSKEMESRLLGEYIKEFGELPPLNHQA